MQCDKLFSVESGLHYHINSVHDKNKKYKCKTCEKQFASRHGQREHTLYRRYEFTWNQIFASSNGPKMSFLAISGSEPLKLPKSTFLGPFEITEIWFHVKLENVRHFNKVKP